MFSRTPTKNQIIANATPVWSYDVAGKGKLKLTRTKNNLHAWRFHHYVDGSTQYAAGEYLLASVALQNAAHVLKLNSKPIMDSWRKTLDNHSRKM